MVVEKVQLYEGIARSPSNLKYDVTLCLGCLGILIRRNKNVRYTTMVKNHSKEASCERCSLKNGDNYQDSPVTYNKQTPFI